MKLSFALTVLAALIFADIASAALVYSENSSSSVFYNNNIRATDGDWATPVPLPRGDLGYENYSKPAGAVNGWLMHSCGYNISYEGGFYRNITLPANCLARNPVEIYTPSTEGTISTFCYNSTEWELIDYDECSGSNQFWESAMWWEISASTGVVTKNPISGNIIPLIISIGILLSIITTIFDFESQDPKETAGEILGIIIIIIIVATALKIYMGL